MKQRSLFYQIGDVLHPYEEIKENSIRMAKNYLKYWSNYKGCNSLKEEQIAHWTRVLNSWH